MTTVLILDADVGFVFWCGWLLHLAGYRTMPAISVPEATAILRTLHPRLDVLIVSPELDGVGDFVRSLRRAQKHVRVIAALQFPGELEGRFLEVDTVRIKSTEADEYEAFRWRTAVQVLLSTASIWQ